MRLWEMTFILIPIFVSLVDQVWGVLTKTEFWVTGRVGKRERAFDVCHSNGGRLLDLETPQFPIFLQKVFSHHFQELDNKDGYYTGLRMYGDELLWDEGCRPATPSTVEFATRDFSSYDTSGKLGCFQVKFREGLGEYMGLDFHGLWLGCNKNRRMICEILTTDECDVVVHDDAKMAANLPKRVVSLEKKDVRLCSSQCDVQTVDGKPCWFYRVNGKSCHLWFAVSQPIVSPLQNDTQNGFTIYAKDCVDIIFDDLGMLASEGYLSTTEYKSCGWELAEVEVDTIEKRTGEGTISSMTTISIDKPFTTWTNQQVKGTAATTPATPTAGETTDTSRLNTITSVVKPPEKYGKKTPTTDKSNMIGTSSYPTGFWTTQNPTLDVTPEKQSFFATDSKNAITPVVKPPEEYRKKTPATDKSNIIGASSYSTGFWTTQNQDVTPEFQSFFTTNSKSTQANIKDNHVPGHTTNRMILTSAIPTPMTSTLPACQCACAKEVNYTASEKEQFTNEIVANLTIDVTKTSAHVRKYVSAKDDRPSAKSVGGFGAIMLVIAFGTPVLLDLFKVAAYFRRLVQQRQRQGKLV